MSTNCHIGKLKCMQNRGRLHVHMFLKFSVAGDIILQGVWGLKTILAIDEVQPDLHGLHNINVNIVALIMCFYFYMNISALSACRNGWTQYENSCYHLSRDTETWAEAQVSITCIFLCTNLRSMSINTKDPFRIPFKLLMVYKNSNFPSRK